MKMDNKLFGIIVFAMTTYAVIASPFTVQAGPRTETTATSSAGTVKPVRRPPLTFRKEFTRPIPLVNCPTGYKAIAPEDSSSPETLTPGNKFYVEEIAREGGWNAYIYQLVPKGDALLCEDPMRRPSRCSLPIVTLTGAYVCRLDDFPTDDICPEGSILERISMETYRCMRTVDTLIDVFTGATCQAGFHEENRETYPVLTYLTCVKDGTSWEQEMKELEQGTVCLNPNTRKVWSSSNLSLVDIGCAYLTPN